MDIIISLAFYALAGLLMAALLVSIFQQIGIQQKKKALLNVMIDEEDYKEQEELLKQAIPKLSKNPYTRLKQSLDKMYLYAPNERRKNQVFLGVVAIEFVSFVAFMLLQKFFVAFLFVVIIHMIALKLIQIKTYNLKDYVQTDLPSSIKHVVKVLTKTNDLRTVFFDASKGMKEPLRSRFVEMSRLMGSASHEKALMKFANDTDSIWAYSFAFIMSSYKESSKKSEIIRNLTLLGEMMEAENRMAERQVTERKPITVLNNMLIILAILTLLGNLWKNHYALTFFFETPGGVMSLVMGFTCLGIALIINFMVGRRRY